MKTVTHGVAGAVAWLAVLPVQAGEPAGLETLAREMRIANDVIATALDNSLPEGARVVGTDTAYLAGQGVLMEFDLSRRVRPIWQQRLERAGGGSGSVRTNEFDAIPHLVQEVFANVQMAIAPYEPEDLEELRQLREEQREIRNEQRQLRRQVRSLRGELNRLSEQDRARTTATELERDIEQRERELAALQADYAALESDIDDQYERLAGLRQRDPPPATATGLDTAEGIADAVATVACDYGATLRSLPEGEHLTLRLRDRQRNTFYVFQKEDLVACRRESISPSQLLEGAYVYGQ